MSIIAELYWLPKSALAGLREAAVPQRRSWFRPPQDSFLPYLREHGREVADYAHSGVVLATALSFLEEQFQIDLMRSEYPELAEYLSEQRGVSCLFLTEQHRVLYENRLIPGTLDEATLRD